MIDIERIKEIIPHRNPFLLVDRILEINEGKRAVGIKNVTINEPYFLGHFPDYPVMPGVLIVEALAQVGGVAMSNVESNNHKIGLLTGIDNCRFKRQVKPGDQLLLVFDVIRIKGQIVKGKGVATVNNELVCESEIMFAFSSI
ncbi:3-hydroxyacyl-ACP dehydratase FabZ [Paenibacillus sp. FSL E2-8871]|uniref:3-hydroxyacyl-[acyl-carrier-protein] dehydratase FabZ n=1 Tax=Paenibacillus odorifer TaxID=189426 RepID=A0A1R0Z7P2_9BACL|nr:3-hydroxyacyl-ACP dehydratase FabZ [Paenibacillus odorifer]OMD44683.1 3-hydroxyacyl-[acyl-carrier-protein] dehydratase FabZ [Paenibacillus odorifer]OME64173.1 3-hydroxyacyl-[acyl-carrier-protein] dehydratase FabZ [Paenibacillus odorifer]